ncbi:MAG: DUF2920 family protein [Lachnospiraceae bacterium]|jgi:hypothetical protein|nr:DUF2920 family protein [Lachnospiraceae bacterium]MEE3460561.1 DUF2920 family protein [Lachnospiraceae bacterium]
MSSEYHFTIPGQSFWGCKEPRNFDVYISLPDDKVIEASDKLPGICLVVSGFGGDARAHVYRKLRRLFSDEKDLVIVQCDYFGYEYMGKELDREVRQSAEKVRCDPLSILSEEEWQEALSDEKIIIRSHLTSSETPENFCEMGIFQALDCVRALKKTTELLESAGLNFDKNNIIGYGFSQGAYLLYLINAMYPDLFSLIIDNSAWFVPRYFTRYRRLFCESLTITCPDNTKRHLPLEIREYFHASDFIEDKGIYDLRTLYTQFRNRALILSYHGTLDTFISLEDKRNFLQHVNNTKLHIVSSDNIDGTVFTSARHGLGTDFIEFFRNSITDENIAAAGMCAEKGRDLWNGNTLSSDMYCYHFTEDGTAVRKFT